MQVNSIGSVGNTNFGLKIDKEMQELLDKSREVAKNKGQEEYNAFVRAEKMLNDTANDEYKLHLGFYHDGKQEIKVITPYCSCWFSFKIQGEKVILTASNIINDLIGEINRLRAKR